MFISKDNKWLYILCIAIFIVFKLIFLIERTYPSFILKCHEKQTPFSRTSEKDGVISIKKTEVQYVKLNHISSIDFLMLNFDDKNVLGVLFNILAYMFIGIYAFKTNEENIFRIAGYRLASYATAAFILGDFFVYFGQLYTNNWFVSHHQILSESEIPNNLSPAALLITMAIGFAFLKSYRTYIMKYSDS